MVETFFCWTTNAGNYSSLCSQKCANLCLKCTEIGLAARLAGGAYALPYLSQPHWGSILLRGGGKGKWLFSKVDGREERGEGNPPKVKESRINTAQGDGALLVETYLTLL